MSDDNNTCPRCGKVIEIGMYPFCNKDGGHGRATNSVIGDDPYVGGLTLENCGPRPVTFYSRSEHMRYLKEHHLVPAVRHVGFNHTDKSPHTIRWYSGPCVSEEERLKSWYEHEATMSHPLVTKPTEE